MPDEKRLIQAIRDNDIRTALVMLSLLVDGRSGIDPQRDAEAFRMRRERRQLQSRKQYVAELARKIPDVPVVVEIEPRNQPIPAKGCSPSRRSRSDANPKQH